MIFIVLVKVEIKVFSNIIFIVHHIFIIRIN